ncbi:hypothetical protein [Neorhizobium galegae]|uniref:hypothetical protein n=1 Tax=Neorhizobium galegae TaxID=399 RepID=UPI001F1F9601|nr:hypothetical protein [Neorhizobium galegae]UIK04902.1 hypothetical protein LZK81_19945 [Neorhizobium galegae]
MTKTALIVLAACVDIRSGERFERGDTFDPVPTLEQANRLIAAGCLPEGARELAEKADEPDEQKAASEKAARDKAEKEALKLVEARSAKATADQALENAKNRVAQATTAEEKTASEKAFKSAEAAAKAASEDLAKLAK